MAYLRRVQLEKLGKPVDGEPHPSDILAPEPPEADTDAPVVPSTGEQPEPGSSSPPQEKPVETVEKPADGAPKEPEKPPQEGAQPTEDDDTPTLDEPDIADTRRLAAVLKDNPELDKALTDAGIKGELFAAARVAAKGAKFMEIFNGDLETAQNAAQEAERYGALSQMMTGQQSLDDTRALLKEIMQFDYELDDEGKPVMMDDGQGHQILKAASGSVGRFIDNTFQIGLDYWAAKAKAEGDEDLAAAVNELHSRIEKASGSAQPDYSHLDEQTKARLEQADAREKEVANRVAADRARQEQEFENNVTKGVESKVDEEIGKLLSTATLTDGQKKWALDQIKERVTTKLMHSTAFFTRMDALMRRPMSEKTQQARVTHGINSARPLLSKVAREVLDELGVQYKANRQSEQARVAAQTQASRSEIKGGAQPAKPAAAVTPADINRMAAEELKAAGKDPNNSTLMFQKVYEIKKRLGVPKQ